MFFGPAYQFVFSVQVLRFECFDVKSSFGMYVVHNHNLSQFRLPRSLGQGHKNEVMSGDYIMLI